MSMTERTHNAVMRVSHEELARLHRLADDAGEAIAVVFRRWLNEAYRARWGNAPAPAPTLKHTKRTRRAKR